MIVDVTVVVGADLEAEFCEACGNCGDASSLYGGKQAGKLHQIIIQAILGAIF